MSTLRIASRTGDGTLGATLALAAVTVAVAAGMGRLFEDGSYLLPLATAGVVAHAVSWAGRRLGASLAVTAAVVLAAVWLVAAWVVLPETTTLGIPGPGTLDAALTELGRARALFDDVVAPAPVTDGFVIAAMTVVAGVAVLADWSAFRLQGLFEPVLPSLLLFCFTAALGADRHRSLFVGLYLAAVGGFLLVHQAGLHARAPTWLGDGTGGSGWRLKTGAALAASAVAAGVVVGPSLPGADDPAVMSLRQGGDGRSAGRRTAVSPLVDIRTQLVDRSDTEVFTVRAPTRAYWRLTALDRFDGRVWSLADASAADGRPGVVPGRSRTERVTQEVAITTLSSQWLPAAYRALRVEGADHLRYVEHLDAVMASDPTPEGLTYRVESAVPRHSGNDLRQARPGASRGPGPDPFVRLPPLAPRVRALAQRVAAGAGDPSPFAKALALQDFLRRQFTYDLTVGPGHDERALESFLFDTRRGYCEQFAGAYAVLARAVGLPTRVAVGFTPGELGPDRRYHVRGLNAHAWPEVHLEGFGWVAFEPTPGRGAPASSYTGVAEAQARPEEVTTATTVAPTATSAPAPAGPTTTGPEQAGPEPGRTGSSLTGPMLIAVAVLVGFGLVVSVPVAKRLRRRRRRAAATTGAERVLVAWAEVAESLAQAGARRGPAETLEEHGRRAAATASLRAPADVALFELAGAAAAASYGAGPLPETMVTRAVTAASAVEAALVDAATPAQRLGRGLDPRPLLPSYAGTSTARPDGSVDGAASASR